MRPVTKSMKRIMLIASGIVLAFLAIGIGIGISGGGTTRTVTNTVTTPAASTGGGGGGETRTTYRTTEAPQQSQPSSEASQPAQATPQVETHSYEAQEETKVAPEPQVQEAGPNASEPPAQVEHSESSSSSSGVE